ncbi:PREDICTED: igE-binding protein-like [Elephantulus edwardii]|uniref:igE-binding protein-like n=1 Tax=Elephantulus edwardii TaxID=28737 RepID=UPI0003F074B8|nr:PREDICTED: igE-binding protein-like [Elephantulus edwardii]
MGNSPSCPVKTALKGLLKAKDLELKDRIIENFLKEVDRVAPWYAVSGHLTINSWDKLGRDLDAAWEEGHLRAGVRGVWKLVRDCLKNDKCVTALRKSEEVLEQIKETRSEESQSGERLYPSLEDASDTEDKSSDSDSSSEEHLDDLEEKNHNLLLRLERARLLKKGKRERRKQGRDSEESPPCHMEPSAPPIPLPYGQESPPLRTSFCPEAWRQAAEAFPVFEDANQQRYHEPVDFKQLKTLAESVKTYGVGASFTLALLEHLALHAQTPADWQSTVKACLTVGQYLDWKSLYTDYALGQARQNAAQGQPAWTFDMLTGQGQWANNQTVYPLQVYTQINEITIKAWKKIPNKGEVTGNLSKIIQGLTEPSSDFVGRMVEAAGKIFGDLDTAMPLVEQLIYEQSTRACQQTITPWKNKGLQVWLKFAGKLVAP